MVRKTLIPAVAILGMVLAGSNIMSANAQSANSMFIFDNSKGLVSASACTLASDTDTKFRISLNSNQPALNYENIRKAPQSRSIGKLVNYSLVKIREDVQYSQYEPIEVTGVSVAPGLRVDAPMSEKAQRGTQGYMYSDSLQSLENYVIQITGEVELEADGLLTTVPGINKAIKGAFLQAAMNGQAFINYRCGEKTYTAFDVHVAEIEGAAARILVESESTKIFKEIRTYTASEAESAILEAAETAQKNQAVQATSSGMQIGPQLPTPGTEVEDLNDVEVDAGPVITTAPIVADNFFQEVVCLADRDSKLNVRTEDQKEILFTLGNGAKVKKIQDFPGNVTENIKIQDLNSSKVGWVAAEFIKQLSNCSTVESDLPAASNTTATAAGDKIEVGDYTVCTESGDQLTVYDTDFQQLERGFYLDSGEKAKVIDGILVNKPTPNGYKYVKVTTESNYTRYVAKDFLTQGKCDTAVATEESSGGKASGEYIFPLYTGTGYSYIAKGKRPSTISVFSTKNRGWGLGGYNGNWGLYGANRSKGRGHAATDLYQKWGQKMPSKGYSSYNNFGGAFRAMTDGKVVRGATAFYLGTYYIVVAHTDGTVSRYGEIFGSTVYSDNQVKRGEKLGYVRWVGENSVAPMLHFENYYPKNGDVKRGVLAGNKKVNGRNTQRSTHLFDRTSFMKKLEQSTF